jgi:serine/threonine protein kinase/Flp pilus assembly protein TadD
LTNEETIFAAALRKSSAAERDAYLDQACAGNIQLRHDVEGLLRAHERAGGILEVSPLGTDGMEQTRAASEGVGATIGSYKLLEQIGGGGMGVVYMAEQLRPVRRKVALKIIKPGMDSAQIIARFEAERQALTMMDHPNIAKVLDAGTTDAGRPYFVMELVKGIPVTDYCDQARLNMRQRLELFINVCNAVQHAHQKGVIHRDLKPSNVLVTLHDDKPVPKVIDFGIAKAAGQLLTDKTLFTNYAQMLGTPLYMSPEQAQISGLDVDTRSDVYALGVLLYELLTGTTPFDKQRLREAAYDEMRRIIREEDPPKPSTRLSTMGQKLTLVSQQRRTDIKHLGQLVRGELDWIVMKALEKDRTCRYETATGLARDVGRYLNDEPVQACPPSATYKLRKFARRHKGPMATAALLLACVMAGIVLLLVNNGRLAREQRRTQAQFERAQGEFARADDNLDVALQALDEVYMKEVQTRISRDHQLTGPDRELFKKGVNFYQQFARRNSARDVSSREFGQANSRVGYLFRELQQPQEAKAAFANAIPVFEGLVARSPEDAAARHELASCLYGLSMVLSDLKEQQPPDNPSHRAVALWQGLMSKGAGSRDDRLYLGHALWQEGSLASTARHFEEAQASLGSALQLFQKLSEDFPDEPFYRQETAYSHRLLAVQVCAPTGRLEEAAEHYSQAAEIYAALSRAMPGKSSYLRSWAFSLTSLAGTLKDVNRAAEAEAALKQAAAVREKLIEPYRQAAARQPTDASAQHAFADALAQDGKFADAEAAYRAAIRIDSNDAGRHHNLADVLMNQHKFADAATEYTSAIRINPKSIASYHSLGYVSACTGNWKQAAAAYRKCAELAPDDMWSCYRWATASLAIGELENYRAACREMLRRFAGTSDRQTAECTAKACALSPQSDADAGAMTKLIDLAMKGSEASGDRKWYEGAKGLVDYRAGDYQAAADIIIHSAPSHDSHRDALAFSILAMAQQRLGQTEKARTSLASAQEIIAAKMPHLEKGETFDGDWLNWLHAQILCREAENLLPAASAPRP